MNATTLLQKQLNNVNSIFHSIVEDMTDQEWVARPAPGQNLLGFTAWHIPRTQDLHAQLWMRGVPELVHGDRWARWRHLSRLGNGAGISLEEADTIAHNVLKADVLAYADEVQQEVVAWMKDLDETDLDGIPNYRQRLAPYPEYQTPGYLEEAVGLLDQPIWSQYMRPCIGHVQRHLGELQVVKDILRARGDVGGNMCVSPQERPAKQR